MNIRICQSDRIKVSNLAFLTKNAFSELGVDPFQVIRVDSSSNDSVLLKAVSAASFEEQTEECCAVRSWASNVVNRVGNVSTVVLSDITPSTKIMIQAVSGCYVRLLKNQSERNQITEFVNDRFFSLSGYGSSLTLKVNDQFAVSIMGEEHVFKVVGSMDLDVNEFCAVKGKTSFSIVADDPKKIIEAKNMFIDTWKEVNQLCNFVWEYPKMKLFPKGIIFHGPSGVGKSIFADALAANFKLQDITVAQFNASSALSSDCEKLESFIKDSVSNPSKSYCLFIDNLHVACGTKDREGRYIRTEMGSSILRGFEEIQVAIEDGVFPRITIIGLSQHIGLEAAFLRLNSFCKTTLISSPSLSQRRLFFNRELKSQSVELLELLASRTRGYTFSDMKRVVYSVVLGAVCNNNDSNDEDEVEESKESEEEVNEINESDKEDFSVKITENIIEKSLREVRPSQLLSLNAALSSTTWKNVGGLNKIKERLDKLIVRPLLSNRKEEEEEERKTTNFDESERKLAVTVPKGVLICGPHGSGKSLVARAVAGEAKLSTISVKCPELYSKYLGDSEALLRTLFARARAAAPCVIILDEVDVIAGKRDLEGGGGGQESGNQVRERMLATLLNEMDGVEATGEVLVISISTSKDVLDAALLRPGRTDEIIELSLPSSEERLSLLHMVCRPEVCHPSLDLSIIAKDGFSLGFTPADVKHLYQEAVMIAIRSNKECRQLELHHFLEARKSVRRDLFFLEDAFKK